MELNLEFGGKEVGEHSNKFVHFDTPVKQRGSKQNAGDEEKPILTSEQVFGFEDRTPIYLYAEKYDEAYTMMKKKLELGMELSYARDLMTFHNVCMMSRNSEKAEKVRTKLAKIIREEIPLATHQKLQAIALRFYLAQKFLEATLFYSLAADFYERYSLGGDAATGISNCCSGIRNVIKGLYAKTESANRSLIQHHFVPLMRNFRKKIADLEGIDNSFRTYCEAHCLHCIEYIEGHIKDYEGCEATLEEAITLIETRLAGKCKTNRVFATLLNNLAYLYEITGRLEGALKLYRKAITSDGSAIDYRSDAERMNNVKAGEMNVMRVYEKLRKENGAPSAPMAVGKETIAKQRINSHEDT